MLQPRILSKQQAVLLIVDVQESFRKELKDLDALTRNITILIEAAKILGIPVFLFEQYPQGLGKTLTEIKACLGEHKYFEKTVFSCCQAKGFMETLESLNRKQIIICGIESHICINQTVHEILQHGYTVHLISDAITSRSLKNREIGWEKMVIAGAIPSSTEMALFEILGESGTEQFKAVQRLVK